MKKFEDLIGVQDCSFGYARNGKTFPKIENIIVNAKHLDFSFQILLSGLIEMKYE